MLERLLRGLRAHITALRLEVAAFALLAILPLVPYLVVLMRGVPRYVMVADFALIEHDTRHVFQGETLLGLESRFFWHHPGPMFFYFVAPFTSAYGLASTGIFVGTWVLVALSMSTLAAATRVYCTRNTSLALLVGLAAWYAAFGNVATNPWNRIVYVVPMLAFYGVAALFARGMKGAVYPLVFFGAMVAETHVSTVTSVGAIGTLSFASFLFHARRRGTLRKDARHLLIAAGLLFLFILPMLIEQWRAAHDEGNFTKLYKFIKHRQEPFKSYGNAFKNWGLATSWLPDRILDRRMATEGPLPMMMRWDAVPTGWSTTAKNLTMLHVGTAIAAVVIAVRRRDFPSLAFLAFGIAGEVIAITSLRAIAGEEQYSLFYWISAPCILTWIGVVATLMSWAAPRLEALKEKTRHTRYMGALPTLMVAVLLISTTASQQDWTIRNPNAPSTSPDASNALHEMLVTIETRLRKDGSTPVIHMAGGWALATPMALELEKDGFDVRYGHFDLWTFAGARPEDPGGKSMHIWFRSYDLPLPIAPCLEKLGQVGTFETFVGPMNIDECPPPATATPPPNHSGQAVVRFEEP